MLHMRVLARVFLVTVGLMGSGGAALAEGAQDPSATPQPAPARSQSKSGAAKTDASKPVPPAATPRAGGGETRPGGGVKPSGASTPRDARQTSPAEAVNIFTDAANFQNEGAFALAAEEWEKFLKQFPKDPLALKARHYAGVCHLQLKHLDRAAAHFQGVLAASPDFELAEDAYLNLGWCQFSLAGRKDTGRLASALTTFGGYLQKFPQGKYADQARYFLAEARYQRGEKEQAVQAYRQFLEQHAKSGLRSSGMYALGVALEELRQYPAAGAVYDTFLAEFPQNDLATEVRLRKAETLLQTGAAAEAEKLLAAVAGVSGFEAADYALLRQAFAAQKQDRFSDAGDLYASLVQRFPKSAYVAEATLAAGRSYYSARRYDEATRWFQQVLDRRGADTAEAAHWICRILLRSKEARKVVDIAEGVLSAGAEGDYRVHLQMDLADALYELDEWRADSIARYLEIVARHPQHELAPQALYNAAFAAMELKQFEVGLRHALSFAEKYPRDLLVPDAQFVAAECRLLQGRPAEAEPLYRMLIERHAQHADANAWRIRLALSLYLQQKYGEVSGLLAAVVPQLKQPGQLAEAHYLVGASHYQRQDFDGALQALGASLAADPRWRQADETLLLLAAAQRAAGRLEEARRTLDQLVRDFPQSAVRDQAVYRLGEYAAAAGDVPAAVAAYDRVAQEFASSPLAPYAAYGKGSALLKAKDYAAAVGVLTDLLSRHREHAVVPDAYLARGMAQRQLGQYAPAIADFSEFLRSNPAQPRRSDALYERGLAEVGQESYRDAAATFERLLADHPAYPLAANVLYELAWARKKSDDPAAAVAAFARLAQEFGDSPLAAEALFHVGEDAYEKGEYPAAVKAYGAARQKGEGEIAEKATYRLGWTLFKMGDFAAAYEQFAGQIAGFGKGPLSGDARFMAAECLFKQSRHQEAYAAFVSASQQPSAVPDMQVLTYLHGGQSAAQLQKWQESLELLDQIPARFSESAYLPEALYERGWAKQNLQRLDDAVADYEQAAARSRGEVGARARFMIGEILFERKQYDEALKSFLRVMYGFGGDKASDDVKVWQGSAGFEAGRCVDVQLQKAQDPQQKAKLLQDAKTYYRYVAERHPRHKLAGQAKQRAAELARLP